jgi:hypothetical protein
VERFSEAAWHQPEEAATTPGLHTDGLLNLAKSTRVWPNKTSLFLTIVVVLALAYPYNTPCQYPVCQIP